MTIRIFFCLLIAAGSALAQAPGTWQDHLSLNNCNSVTKLADKMYASNYNGLVWFYDNELAPTRLNKINGLNDVGIRLVRANPYNNRMLVIYENSNIDIIDANGAIYNYPDLKLKTMSTKKIVNEVTFDNQYAYMACGFGIVVFDTEKLEIRETYYIGPNGSFVDVHQVAFTGGEIFAATSSGLFQANRNRSLVNFNNWYQNPGGLPAGVYNGVVNVEGTVLVNKSKFAETAVQGQDTIFEYLGTGWRVWPHQIGQGKTVLKMGYTSGNLFTLLLNLGIEIIDVNVAASTIYIVAFNGEFDYGTLNDNYFFRDYSGNMAYWTADRKFGLTRTYTTWDPQPKIELDGMNNRTLGNIDILDGKVAVSPSHVFKEGRGSYIREGINLYEGNDWTYVPVTDPSIIDVNSVLIDRKDPTTMWATAWGYGILQFKDNKLVQTYTPDNAGVDATDVGECLTAAVTQDEEGNIWVSNYLASNRLGVIIPSKKQYVPAAPGGISKFTRRMMFDSNQFLWMAHEREGGLSVAKIKNTAVQNFSTLTMQEGAGNLGSNSVYCMAEDHDGRLWIGTGAGIRVLYNPDEVFDQGADHDAQPIKIEQDGNVELLLGAETVTDIHVDGANNKWVGTSTGGVYCFSPDGLRQLFHFTTDNSPLYSNSIIDLNYDNNTGDLYIGSEQGLQSYRGVVISGFENYNTLHAYPNPVRPGYGGTVLLRGLVDDSLVKITDVAGNLVWETRAVGGQVEWPLTTLQGRRVVSGVYIVYTSTATADLKAVTKVLVMN